MKLRSLLLSMLCLPALAGAQDYHPATNASPNNHELFVDEVQRDQVAADRERERTEQYRVDAERTPSGGIIPFNTSREKVRPVLLHLPDAVVALAKLNYLGHKSEKAVGRYLSAQGWKPMPASDSGDARVIFYEHGEGNLLSVTFKNGSVAGFRYSGTNDGLYGEALTALQTHADISDAGSDYFRFKTDRAVISFLRKHSAGESFLLDMMF